MPLPASVTTRAGPEVDGPLAVHFGRPPAPPNGKDREYSRLIDGTSNEKTSVTDAISRPADNTAVRDAATPELDLDSADESDIHIVL